jgi:hypothetical protein
MAEKHTVALAWGNCVSQSFAKKVLRISDEFGWSPEHPDWLMACMAFETGETFSPNIRNAAGSGACGLIQFMPATADDLGYAMRDIERMTAEQQLDVVQVYFRPYHRRIKSLSDMYMAILLPKYIGRPDDAVLFNGGIAYRQNAGLDADQDGKITKAEASAKVMAKLSKGRKPPRVGVIAL